MIKATAVVLTGGKSRRMGRDKGQLNWRGQPLLHHWMDHLSPLFDQVLISVATSGTYPERYSHEVVDHPAYTGQGPLAGMEAGLRNARNEAVWFFAVDMPGVNREMLSALKEKAEGASEGGPVVLGTPAMTDPSDKASPDWSPLPCVLHRVDHRKLCAYLDSGNRRLMDFLRCARPQIVLCSKQQYTDCTVNLNTPEDVKAYWRNREGLRGIDE